MYGRGASSLANELGVTVKEAKAMMRQIMDQFPDVERYIDEKASYPATHEGKLDTILGEKIFSYEEEHRQRRHGINTVVQGFTAVILAFGFENLIKVGKEQGIRISPISVVHDSNCNYIDAKFFWDIQDFYYKNFTEFLYDLTGVKYKFSVLLGTNYYDSCELKQLDYGRLRLEGTGLAINELMQRLDDVGVKYSLEVPEGIEVIGGRLPEIYHDSIEEFIRYEAREPIYHKDISHYKVILNKID